MLAAGGSTLEQRDPGGEIWPGAGRPDRLSLPHQRRTCSPAIAGGFDARDGPGS
jgi:hypothetical protein